MTARARYFPRVAIPLAVVAAAVVAVQLGHEFSMPTEGPSRAEEMTGTTARLLRFGSAAVLSVATLLLAVGLRADRAAVAARDDRLAGEYLAAGLLAAIVCAFTGALPGVLVAVSTVLATAWLRRRTEHPRGEVARDVQNLSFVLAGMNLLLFGVRESFAAWVHWSRGYGLDGDQVRAVVAEHHGDVVLGVLLIPAIALTLLLPLLLWRHRRAVRSARSTLAFACFAVVVLSVLGQNWAGCVIGLACLVAVAVAGRGGAAART